jgi:hypothetical protein
MSIITVYPRNGAPPLVVKFLDDTKTAIGYQDFFGECVVEVIDEKDLPAKDWRQALLRK